MIIFYIIALIAALVALVLWIWNHKLVYLEVLGAAAIAFLLAAVFHVSALYSLTGDTETWSGQITEACFHPRWVEEIITKHNTYDDEGNVTGSYTTTSYSTHHEYWDAKTSTGENHNISKEFYNNVVKNFGNKIVTKKVYKSGFYSGDRNIYIAENNTGYIYPTTTTRSFQNRLKAAHNLFQFEKPAKMIKIYSYPKNDNWLQSARLIGKASNDVSLLDFDRMNSRLGPFKLVNVIIVGFDSDDSSLGRYQEAAWLGGKKNDLVICYGSVNKEEQPSWVYCFGWTEHDILKRRIESIVLEEGINLKKIETEIIQTYVIKDWSKFDYLTMYPSALMVVLYFLCLLVCESVYFMWCTNNEYEKSIHAH